MSKLLSKHDKANSLYALGYAAELRGEYVIVTTPENRQYRLDPRRLTCTCTGYVTHKEACKHVRGLRGLLLDTAASIDDNRDDCREPGNANRYTPVGMERRRLVVELQERAWEVLNVTEGAETMGRAA